MANHFSEVIDAAAIRPAGAKPVIVRLASGGGNHVASNNVVARDVHATSNDSAFAAQVDALLTTGAGDGLSVTTVLVDPESSRNTILDSGCDGEVVADRTVNAIRATPAMGA